MAWSWEHPIPDDAADVVSSDGTRLATLLPIASSFVRAPCAVDAIRRYVLSRFAYMHCERGAMMLESPLSHARIVLHDWRAAGIVHLLAQPRRFEELRSQMPDVAEEAMRALLALLQAANMASEAGDDGGGCAMDDRVPLRSWEFHDLLFHARSRGGRHDQPVGGTYRFRGEFEPPPPLPESRSTESPISLYRPDLRRLEETDPPFARVQEARRSVREYGAHSLTAQQLGEFFFRVGRVADYWEEELPAPGGAVRLTAAVRPYPAAGALYELDLYLIVNRCDGIDPGLYGYDPERHALRPWPAPHHHSDALLADASLATAIPQEQLQVLIIIAARFQRVAWKYSSIAYSLVLKDVGVLFDTMYLAATAMGLAPCAVGCGNADLFASAAGLEYYAATSVGEFLIGSRGNSALDHDATTT
jgi:SagB-type dehydrogenase family enzyme